jgi:rhodanese-related sulfurtransferase
MLKTPGQLAEEARAAIPEISAEQVRKDLATGRPPYALIDVREPEEVAAGQIPGAVPIPRGTLEISITRVVPDENAPIVCYCGGGTRSLLAGQQLKNMGYRNVTSMAGGMRAWKMGGGTTV